MATPDIYVEFPGGTRWPEGYIAPAIRTGRVSGNLVHVALSGGAWKRYTWTQWVRKEQILQPDEVEES